jgi:hypothetical protein
VHLRHYIHKEHPQKADVVPKCVQDSECTKIADPLENSPSPKEGGTGEDEVQNTEQNYSSHRPCAYLDGPAMEWLLGAIGRKVPLGTGYTIFLKRCKLLEQIKLRGLKREDWFHRLVVTVYTLMRLQRLIPIAEGGKKVSRRPAQTPRSRGLQQPAVRSGGRGPDRYIDFLFPTDSMNLMATITVEKKPKSKRIVVEIDADKLERLAASLGLFSSSFLDSIARSEKEIALGKTARLRHLRDLRCR